MKLACLAFALSATSAAADAVPPGVRAHAVRRDGAIHVDGHLDEPGWQTAPKQGSFTQRFPKDGVKADLDTQFAVVYDDRAIYVGVWCDDPQPEHLKRYLTRRDVDVAADAVVVGFDSYHDRRTAYAFQLNAAGVQRDMLLFDDSNQDDTWDAVWTGDVSVGPHGWTAEFRIPLNQLRFAGSDGAQEWGIQVLRVVGRTQEQQAWSPWPRTAPQVVSRFGVLDGIERLHPGRRLELLPYASAGFDVMPIDAADPLNDATNLRRNAGLDLRYGLGPAFTLSATLNPDFGQVEADPSQINLSGNELFFAEKRPFFLEGVDLFKLPIGQSNNTVEGQFYSRRIGAPAPDPDVDYDYIHKAATTTIYGAAKLTGKTPAGWSVGVLDAVTGQQSADIIDADGNRAEPIVAPLTNYAIARVKHDYDEGRSSIGGSVTAVNRALSGTPLVDTLHDQAYTAGFQVQHRFGDTPYQIDVHGVGSYVHGSEDAIASDQTAIRHLYQRPDLRGDHFDPTRTSLSGFDISWNGGKIGETKHWRWGSGGDLRTRGLELNDIGFQNASDHTIPFVFLNYSDQDPGEQVLNWGWNTDVYAFSTLEPRLGDLGWEGGVNAQLANYWSLGAYFNLDQGYDDPQLLRGGPAWHGDFRYQGNGCITSDTRKRVWANFCASGGRTRASDEIDGGIDAGLTIQARSNIDVFLGPSFSDRDEPMQYIDQVDDAGGKTHYVFGRIRQTVAGLTFRLDWTFSPRLSLQAYAQPYVANGSYTELKDVDNAKARSYRDRWFLLAPALDDNVYTATTRDGQTIQFGRPDFDFMQLRSTLVLRWEYRPGSSVFAIWSHGRTNDAGTNGAFGLGRDLRGLGDADGENIVLVKANYWIGL